MKIHKIIISLLLIGSSTIGWAQTTMDSSSQPLLTLEEAISIALEKNYNIQLERYQVERSQNSVSRALSGQMPTLDLNGSYEWGYANAELQTLGFGSQEGSNAPLELEGNSHTFAVQPQMNVPIFQGFRGKYRYKQLENAQQMSELQLAMVVEQTLVGTVSAYLEVARLQAQLTIDQENLAISYDRWLRAKEDAQFGASNSLRRLQAEVDAKTDSANYRNTQLAYQNSWRNLNLIMNQPLTDEYRVRENMQLSEELDYESLLAEMRTNNTQLLLTQRRIDNAAYEAKVAEASLFPTIQGYANYTYFNSEDQANFLQSNLAYGPNAGITLQYAIFSGGANKIQRQNAQVSLEEQKTVQQSTELTLEKELRNAYAQYANNKEQLRIEESNQATFERNYEKTYEDFKLGLVDASDLRIAQLNLSAAKNRINNLTFAVKQSEIRLLQLSGRLMQ